MFKLTSNSRSIGAILLIVGIATLIAGIFVAMSSIGLATDQQNGAYNAFTSGAFRLYLGWGIDGIGILLAVIGAYLLLHK